MSVLPSIEEMKNACQLIKKEENLINKIQCDLKPNSFCHLEEFSIGILWMKENLMYSVLGRCDNYTFPSVLLGRKPPKKTEMV